MSDEKQDTPQAPTTESIHEESGRLSNRFFVSMIVGSFIFAFASIPAYRIICKKIDPGGSAWQNGSADIYEGVAVDNSRKVTVRFTTSVERQLPWEFVALEPALETNPGAKTQTTFRVKNLDPGGAMKGKGVYDINPPEAGQYFKKIECFCFREQTLEAGQEMELPLVFWFEPDMPEHIKNVTVAYTFFNMESSLKRSMKNREERAAR